MISFLFFQKFAHLVSDDRMAPEYSCVNSRAAGKTGFSTPIPTPPTQPLQHTPNRLSTDRSQGTSSTAVLFCFGGFISGNCFVIICSLYSWLSLSRPRLSRITAYLEVKIWSLPIHENLTTDGKYCRKEEKLLLRSNFSSFPQYFQYISNFKSPVTYQFVKCG